MVISNFEIERIFDNADIKDLNENFVGVFPSDKMNRFFDLKKMMKGKKYLFLISNTDRSDKKGTHRWSILDIDGKKDFLLFDSFGIKGLKNFIVKDDENILRTVLKGVENLKEKKDEINLVNVNFSRSSYNKLTDHQKNSFSNTANIFLHFTESFALHEKQSLIHLWLLEDNIQDFNSKTCGLFQTYFYEYLFFPNSDSILHERKKLTYDVVEEFLKELFTTNTDKNEKIIDEYMKQKNIKIENQKSAT